MSESQGLLNTDETIKKEIINLDILKKNSNLVIDIQAQKSDRNLENLEDLADNASKLGNVVNLITCSDDGCYRISIEIKPNYEGTNLVEVLKNMIEQLNENSKAFQRFCRDGKILYRPGKISHKYTEILDTIKKDNSRLLLMDKIEQDLTQLYELFENTLGVTYEDICSKRNSHNIVKARAITYFILRYHYNEKLSSTDIGKLLGKNHATVLVTLKDNHFNYNKFDLKRFKEMSIEDAFIKSQKMYKKTYRNNKSKE